MFKQIRFQKSSFKLLCQLNTVNKTLINPDKLLSRRDILPRAVESCSVNKPSDWKNVRNYLLNEGNMFTEKNIDSMLLNYCIAYKKYDYAKKYIRFLNEENIKPNLGTIGKQFKLHYVMCCEKLTNEKDEENVFKMYEDLRTQYQLLDPITLEQVICALSTTKRWRKCLDLLEESRATSVPNNVIYNAVVSAAFQNDDEELGWRLFNEMIENNRNPFNITYEAILNRIKKATNVVTILEHLFEILYSHDLYFEKDIATKLVPITRQAGIYTSLTRISKNGVCSNCKAKLDEIQLTNEEFIILRDAFFKEVIVGKNVFCKTSPDELERFKLFVKNMGKFDVVIDGLNTQYSQGVANSPQVISALLADVVNYFINQNKTVLLLGKSHMGRLPSKNWNFIKRNTTVFLTQDVSQDDPFILYCALHSGINTAVVTRDLMRSHLFLLKDKHCKKLFRRWLAQNRLHLVTAKKGTVIFKDPLKYMIAPQKSGKRWHVPYINEIVDFPKSIKYNWICVDTSK